MIVVDGIALALSIGLLGYQLVALLAPERLQ